MKKIRKRIEVAVIKMEIGAKRNDGFGMNELLGIAAALIIAAFIIIPGLQTLTESIMIKLDDWWDVTIVGRIFPIS